MARPSLYKPEYPDLLILHLEKGFTFYSFAGTIRVSEKTLDNWVKAHPDFAEAKEIGTALSRLWWESVVINGGLAAGVLNNGIWIFNMKNRFGWRDVSPEEKREEFDRFKKVFDPKVLAEGIKLARKSKK